MIVTCNECKKVYDDLDHWTYCPHDYFLPCTNVVGQPESQPAPTCPKCGAAPIPCGPKYDDYVQVRFECMSYIIERGGHLRRSDQCLHRELTAANARLTAEVERLTLEHEIEIMRRAKEIVGLALRVVQLETDLAASRERGRRLADAAQWLLKLVDDIPHVPGLAVEQNDRVFAIYEFDNLRYAIEAWESQSGTETKP